MLPKYYKMMKMSISFRSTCYNAGFSLLYILFVVVVLDDFLFRVNSSKPHSLISEKRMSFLD